MGKGPAGSSYIYMYSKTISGIATAARSIEFSEVMSDEFDDVMHTEYTFPSNRIIFILKKR